MTPSSKPIISGSMQLNIAGVGVVALLAFAAWHLLQHFVWGNLIPLAFIGYAVFRVVYDLTFNRKNVPTLATSFAGRVKTTEILKREAESRDGSPYRIIDLGSGRGELTRRIARAIPGAVVMGIEMARIPFWQSVLVQRLLGPQNLSYQCLDFWTYDCSDIDAVVFYLSGNMARKVGEKLSRELKPGSTIISHTFPLMGGWEPIDVLNFRSPFKEVIYVYRQK